MNLEENKATAIAFYKMAYEGEPAKAVELYVGASYTQHNPLVRDGKQGFIDYFDKMHREYPAKTIEFLRCIAEADLVALHTHQVWPGDDDYVTMDFFALMLMEKFVNTGMPYSRCRKPRQMTIRCFNARP